MILAPGDGEEPVVADVGSHPPPQDGAEKIWPLALFSISQDRGGQFSRQLKISVQGSGWRESAVDRKIEDPMCYWETPPSRA